MSPRSARAAAVARAVLVRQHGVAHLRGFLEAGLTKPQMGHLLHLGLLIRPRIGWYADPALSTAAIRALRVGGVLGRTSAAASWGIAVPERSDLVLEVAIDRGTTRLRESHDATRRAWAGSEPDVRWHWEQRLGPRAGWRVSPVDALLQLAACAPRRWLVAAIDSARCSAQHPALITDADLAAVRSALPQHLRAAVDRSDARSETSGETFLRLELADRRVPFVPQAWLTSGYRADGLVDGWLPVEVDGLETHAGREAVIRDRERDAVLAWHGVPPLRFLQTTAVRETAWMCDVIERAWHRGAPPGIRAR